MNRQRKSSLEKIVSGGQTGVDRAALDAALDAKFPCGGWCPADRSAEDGTIPSRYSLTPMSNGGYRERTLRNVLDSDGTVIICKGTLTGGTRATRNYCRRHRKPHLLIDAENTPESVAGSQISAFIKEHGIRVLNVAGPRASHWPEAYPYARRTLRKLLQTLHAVP